MSKHLVFKKKELEQFKPTKKTIQFIENYCSKNNLKKNEIKILDWGCSRGAEVFWLKKEGYDITFGVDIDKEPINNGLLLACDLGYKKSTLRVLSPDGKTDFPDNYFDIIFSNQVLEHVKEIDKVANEMSRITKVGGLGFHLFPGFLYPNEGHLHMPLVHWLPKNLIRYLAIRFYVSIKREPFWPELNNFNHKKRSKAYYEYSINKTFYRNPKELTRTFEKSLFKVSHGKILRTIFFEDELSLEKSL